MVQATLANRDRRSSPFRRCQESTVGSSFSLSVARSNRLQSNYHRFGDHDWFSVASISIGRFGAKGLTAEELLTQLNTLCLRIARVYGLDGEDLYDEANERIIEDDRWRAHPNLAAYCRVTIRSAAIDMCRRRATERKHLKIIGESLDDHYNQSPSDFCPSELGSADPHSTNPDSPDFCDEWAEQGIVSPDGMKPAVVADHDLVVPCASPIDLSHLIDPKLVEIASQLGSVDWGKSTLRSFLLVDSRIVLAKKLIKLSDDELCHLGNQVTQRFTRTQFIEANLPWSEVDQQLQLSDSGLSVADAWSLLSELIEASSVYQHATKKERQGLTKQKLSTVFIAACLRREWPDLKDNTWTAKCVRSWKTVKKQFPQIITDLAPHQRGQTNE